MLLDAGTGEPLAILDSPGINPYKSGATGGVGVDALARPDASTVGLFGSGGQAKSQVRATDVVRDLVARDEFRIAPTKEENLAHRDPASDIPRMLVTEWAGFSDPLNRSSCPAAASRAQLLQTPPIERQEADTRTDIQIPSRDQTE